MPAPPRPTPVGGRACLDFANTVGPRLPHPGRASHDHLPGCRDLVDWAAGCALLTPVQQRRLRAVAEADPVRAAEVHGDAMRLREAIHHVFAAIAHGEPVPAAALASVQDVYVEALANGHLGAVGPARLDWHWPADGPLEQVLWPIARSAVDLAVAGPLARIRQCPGDDGQCGWLFVDTTKSATRRWCSMATCGNRVKSRRQASRRRTTR